MIQGRSNWIAAALCLILIAFAAYPGEVRPVEDPLLSEWQDFSGTPDCLKLLEWLRCRARAQLTGTPCSGRFHGSVPRYFGQLGMFVTLTKGNKVRGCYGAFSHSITDAESLLSDYLAGALTRDPRHKPLDIAELRDTRIIITVTSQPYPINDPGAMDLQHHGVMLQCGNSATIYVPAEIKSIRYIEKNIQGNSCQVSGFRAVTLQ
jgi:hypothetical protein